MANARSTLKELGFLKILDVGVFCLLTMLVVVKGSGLSNGPRMAGEGMSDAEIFASPSSPWPNPRSVSASVHAKFMDALDEVFKSSSPSICWSVKSGGLFHDVIWVPSL